MARRAVHDRRPDDGQRASQPAPHRAGRAAAEPLRLRRPRRSPPGIPTRAGRPAGGLRRTSTGRRSSMTYFEGFVAAVPEANKDEYRKHAADAAPIFREFGVK